MSRDPKPAIIVAFATRKRKRPAGEGGAFEYSKR